MNDAPARLASALADRYRIERELGQGGMATVYLAEDLRHHRKVAIKVLRPELAAALGPERFLREIEIAAGLQHPRILPLFESGEAGQRGSGEGAFLYYVMPYVEGESLRDRLEREERLPLDEALQITREVAAALAYAHARGVVHRDIKPENILLSGGEAVVADFGIARAIGVAGGERITSTGLAIGTPGYMSPEQAFGDSSVDGRSDVYSLACVLYEMLTGEPPYTGHSAQAVFAKRMSEPVPRVSTLRETVPPAVETAITRALAKAPEDRFTGATQFAAALEAPAGTASVEIQRPAARWRSRRVVGAMVIGTVIVAVVAGLILSRGGSGRKTLDPNLIAIAPFDILDPKLELWREGLVDVLSRSLDGAGSLRTASPSVVIRRWKGRDAPEPARALGEATGARLVVYGQLLSHGPDSVRLRTSLFDVATGERLGEFDHSDEVARVDRLADSLTMALLRHMGRTGSGLEVRLASVGTTSLPALKAFLQGERFLRRLSLDSAIANYERAIELDSTFALALRHKYTAYGWASRNRDIAWLLQAARHNHGLSPRDSLLIVADSLNAAAYNPNNPAYWSHGQRVLSILEEAARRYPDDPEVWYELGEKRFHASGFGALARWDQARAAFDRAIALDSGFASAYLHPIDISMVYGDPAAAVRYIERYQAHAPGLPEDFSQRVILAAIAPHGDGVELEQVLEKASGLELYGGWYALNRWPDSAETAIRVTRMLLEDRSEPVVQADEAFLRVRLASSLIYRGHVREAYSLVGNRFGPNFARLALLGSVPTDTVTAVFRSWLRHPDTQDCGTITLAVEWLGGRHDSSSLKGLEWLADSTTRSAATVRARVDAMAKDGLAQAALPLATGDTALAVDRFLALPDSLCYSTIELPSLRFRLLAASGRDREAAAFLDARDWMNDPITVLERARVAERLGDRTTAIRKYQFVADVWRHADPELQPFVREAKDALTRLTGEPRS